MKKLILALTLFISGCSDPPTMNLPMKVIAKDKIADNRCKLTLQSKDVYNPRFVSTVVTQYTAENCNYDINQEIK